MHILALGLNMLIVSGKKKISRNTLMGSIGARKLYLIALILSCQQLQIPSYSHYHLNVLWLWHVCGLRVELYYLSIIDLMVEKWSSFFLPCAYGPEGKALDHLGVWSFSDEDVSVFFFPLIITFVNLTYIFGNLEWLEAPITLEVMHRSPCGN